jgi:DNA-binding MarR family transcriptional regulator
MREGERGTKMDSTEQDFAESLLRIFDNVLLTEGMALSKGYFSDLSIAELHTLNAIGPYEARTMTETANILGITIGTLTVAIDRLVKKKYVERNRDTKDRRIVRISLTRQGKLAYRMHSKFHRVLVKRIMDPLSEEEQKILTKTIQEIDGFVEEQYKKYSNGQHYKKIVRDDTEV